MAEQKTPDLDTMLNLLSDHVRFARARREAMESDDPHRRTSHEAAALLHEREADTIRANIETSYPEVDVEAEVQRRSRAGEV